MNLKEQIEKFKPYNEQEEKDKEMMLKYIDTFDDVLTRENEMCHFTASNWIPIEEAAKVTNEEKMKPIYKKLNEKVKTLYKS